jgi:hypothetical protein
MTVHTIVAFAKENDLSMSAIITNPSYSEKKGRVTKGNGIANKEWNKKHRWEAKNYKKTIRDEEPTAWFLDIKKIGFYVIDVDVCDGKTAKEALTDLAWNMLFETSDYIVETGSKGLHAYYKIPTMENIEIKKTIKVKGLDKWFKEGVRADIDIITDTIICEGSTYCYDGNTYSYNVLKGDIYKTSCNDTVWKDTKNLICQEIQVEKEQEQNEMTEEMNRSIEYNEVIDHINNIPNDNANWEKWYRMGQLIFNILGRDGLDVFIKWSAQNETNNDDRATINLWRGLKEKSNNTLTIGTLLYLSKQNEAEYKKIRAKYNPLSYASIKLMIEEDHFFVEEPEPLYCRIRDRDIITYKPNTFRELMKTYNYKVKDKTKQFYDNWTCDSEKRTYKRFGFYPGNNCPKDEYNRFVKAEASFLPIVNGIDLDPILHHFFIMAGEDEKGKDFLIDFFAQIVQEPHILKGIAIILYGTEGSGKDILIDWMGDKILGSHQYNKPGNIANMFKGFNSELQGKQLFHSDEIDNKTIKKYIEDIKRIITSGKLRIEGKGKDAQSVDSYIRLCMTTNNRDALHLSATDRRMCVFQSSDKYRNDMEYFKTLVAFLHKDGVARTFYDFLMARDISKFDHTNRPQTEIYKEMKQSSINPVLLWISNDEFENQQLKTTEWLAMYNTWAETNKTRFHNPTTFGTTMNEFISKNIGITKQTPKNISKLTIDRDIVLEYMKKEGLLDSE